jgi:ribonuclease HI
MDSEYVRNGVREWAHKWKSRGWRKGNTETPNKDLWEELLVLYNANAHTVLVYVRSSENKAHTYAENAREEQ